MERSNEETRTANASIAPEVTRLQAREAQQSTTVSTMRNHETGLQGQLLNLRQENARINALMNEIQITNSSMNTRNQGGDEATADVKLEIRLLQIKVFHLRCSVERNQSTESRDAQNYLKFEGRT